MGLLITSLFAIALAARLLDRQQPQARPLFGWHRSEKLSPGSDRATISLASVLHHSEPAPHVETHEIDWLFDGSGDDYLVRDLIQRNLEDEERGLLPMDRFLDFV